MRVGSEAAIIVSGRPPIREPVAYIDPRVDSATRTAKVRVEVPNGGEALRLGKFADVKFAVPWRARWLSSHVRPSSQWATAASSMSQRMVRTDASPNVRSSLELPLATPSP